MSTQIPIEVRVGEPGKDWMEIKPTCYLVGLNRANKEATQLCQNIANEHKQEARWNHVGYDQGHYVSSNGKESP
jgi:hypothetical protein